MPKYYANFQSYRNAWQNAFYFDPPVPLNLDIELSTVCNLQCPFCFTTDPKFKNINKQGFMSTELVLQLIDEAEEIGIPALKFNWRGESTLHQDFTQVLKYASRKSAFYEIIINTNGNIPDHAFAGLLYSTKVIVSLDAFGKNLYATMRRNGDIRTVIETVNRLVDRGHNNVWVRRVITKENQGENYFHIAQGIWGNKVKIAEHYCFDRNEKKKHQVKNQKIKHRKYCGYPSQRLLVASDGRIFPCCVDYYETMPLGKFPDNSIMDIWKSNRLSKLRHDLRNSSFNEFMHQCKNCTSYMAYDAYERQFIQDRQIK